MSDLTEYNKLIKLRVPISSEDHRAGDGKQARYEFPNGYGVSVVIFGGGLWGGSYGVEAGLLELAVLKDRHLCYTTPITSDVIGHLTAKRAAELIDKVEALEPVAKPKALKQPPKPKMKKVGKKVVNRPHCERKKVGKKVVNRPHCERKKA